MCNIHFPTIQSVSLLAAIRVYRCFSATSDIIVPDGLRLHPVHYPLVYLDYTFNLIESSHPFIDMPVLPLFGDTTNERHIEMAPHWHNYNL